MYDLLISDGFPIDGTGASCRVACFAISNGRMGDESAQPGLALRPGTRA